MRLFILTPGPGTAGNEISLWVSMVNSGPFLLCSGVKFHTPLMSNILSWIVTVPEALPGDARLEPVSE